ncbi:MAG: TetR/AcrR family transcriptional regulator [Litoreibacter sp.]
MMTDRNTRLIKAALVVFARYGVGKTTMNDIAREADVARQTLYNAYSSKEEVLRAAVRFAADETFDTILTAWDGDISFGEKLDIFFENAQLNWYDIGQASPDAAELFEGIHKAAHEELQHVAATWGKHFERLILANTSPGTPGHDNAEHLADFIYSASTNAKHNASDRDNLVHRLRMLKLSIMALINPTS